MRKENRKVRAEKWNEKKKIYEQEIKKKENARDSILLQIRFAFYQ